VIIGTDITKGKLNMDNVSQRSIEELYIDLGDWYLKNHSLGSKDFPDEQKNIIGKQWFEENRSLIIEKLCPKRFVIAGYVDIVAILTDAFIGKPIITIASIVFKIGVEEFCDAKTSD
jgi:hypothetical protein